MYVVAVMILPSVEGQLLLEIPWIISIEEKTMRDIPIIRTKLIIIFRLMILNPSKNHFNVTFSIINIYRINTTSLPLI